MSAASDRTVMAFFTEPKEREQRRSSDHGEVPEVFKANEFHISVSGASLAFPNPWRPIKLHAVLSIQVPGATEFVNRLTTETIEGMSSPKFTRRATFSPMTMDNSQNEAKRTLVKVDIYLSDDLVFSTTFELARLLWDTRIEKIVEPVIPTMIVVKNRKAAQGRIVVEVVQGRPLGAPPDNHEVVLNFELTAKVWAMIAEQRVYMALCCVGFRGRWNRVYASENVKKPFLRNASTVFPRSYLSRSILINDNGNNPIRIELYGFRKGYPKLLGYCHVKLMDMDKPIDIVWNTGPSSGLKAVMKVTSALVSQNRSEVNLRLEFGTASGRGVPPITDKECVLLNQDQTTFCDSAQSPTALQNASFQHNSAKIDVDTRSESTILTPRNFKVHFPATYRSLLNEATNDNFDNEVCHRSSAGRLAQRLKS